MLVTQWCFGPPIIDRSFQFTGGKCEVADAKIVEGVANEKDIFTNAACRAAGGQWRGGHDISGHVFLLVLGSYFIVQEVGWVYLNHWRRGSAVSMGSISIRDERSVVMYDGAIKSAAVEAERFAVVVEHRVLSAWDALALGGKFAGGVIVASWWMLLMTAIFFHTWFEKVSNYFRPTLWCHSMGADEFFAIVYGSSRRSYWIVRCLLSTSNPTTIARSCWSAWDMTRKTHYEMDMGMLDDLGIPLLFVRYH